MGISENRRQPSGHCRRSRTPLYRSEEIATAVFLAYQLRKPILIEGPPGVGKTQLAKTAAEMFALPLIRLQCYEGLDESKAIYEWKYGKQLLYTRSRSACEILGDARGFRESVEQLHKFTFFFRRAPRGSPLNEISRKKMAVFY